MGRPFESAGLADELLDLAGKFVASGLGFAPPLSRSARGLRQTASPVLVGICDSPVSDESLDKLDLLLC